MEEKIIQQVEHIIPEMIGGIKSIVQIPSVQSNAIDGAPFGKEIRNALDKTLQLANQLGFETVDVDHYMGYARFGPKTSSYICAIGHLDVVAEGTGWKHNPFSAYEEDGVIYSRGILDNKGPILSCLYALYALKNLGFEPQQEIRIIFGCNEETGFQDLKYYLTKEKPPIAGFTPDCKFPVVYAERGRAVIEVIFDNIEKCFEYMNKYILNSKNEGERLGIDYQNNEFGKLEIRNYKLIQDQQIKLQFAISYPSGTDSEQLLTKLQRVNPHTKLISNYPPVYFDQNQPMIQVMKDQYEKITDLDGTPVTTTGGTYAKLMPNIVPFGPSFPGQKGIGHQPNEWMKIEDLIKITKIYALTFYYLARKGMIL